MGPDGRATHAADAIEARPAMGAARQNEFFGWVRGTDEGTSRESLLIAAGGEGWDAGRARAGGG